LEHKELDRPNDLLMAQFLFMKWQVVKQVTMGPMLGRGIGLPLSCTLFEQGEISILHYQ
jgi:hypothetical protein